MENLSQTKELKLAGVFRGKATQTGGCEFSKI